MDKVYVIREYGGSHDDSWEHIMGIFTDKAKAEEFRDSYWKKIQDRQNGIHLLLDKYGVGLGEYIPEAEEETYNEAVQESYRIDDIACVEVKEYPLNEIVNRYYVEEK